MSNLSDLLNGLNVKQSNALGVAGSLMGLAADVSGAAGLLSIASALLGRDKSAELEGALQNIKREIQKVLEGVADTNWRGRWDDINNRLEHIDNAMADPLSVLDSLPDDLTAQPPLSSADRSERVQKCDFALERLRPPDFWHLPSIDPDYYKDAWNGLVSPQVFEGRGEPPPPPPVDVFYDTYILQQYLRAIAIYLLVLRAFFPLEQILQNHGGNIRRHADLLKEVHDTAKAGIVYMAVPFDFPPDGDAIPWGGGSIYNSVPSWTLGLPPAAYYDDSIKYYQPFGAAYMFAGVSAFDKFPPYPDGRYLDASTLVPMAAKIAFASRARWKDVYLAIGLAGVWDIINQLLQFLGEAQLPGRDPGRWWSLREVHSLLTRPIWLHNHSGELSDGTYDAGARIIGRDTIGGLSQLSGLPVRDPQRLLGKVRLSLATALRAAAIRDRVTDLDVWWGLTPPAF